MHISNLYKVRLEKGLSQSTLAQMAGVSLPTIQAYEQGKRNIHNGSISTLIAIAEVLNVPIYRILDDRELVNRLYKVERCGTQ